MGNFTDLNEIQGDIMNETQDEGKQRVGWNREHRFLPKDIYGNEITYMSTKTAFNQTEY